MKNESKNIIRDLIRSQYPGRQVPGLRCEFDKLCDDAEREPGLTKEQVSQAYNRVPGFSRGACLLRDDLLQMLEPGPEDGTVVRDSCGELFVREGKYWTNLAPQYAVGGTMLHGQYKTLVETK